MSDGAIWCDVLQNRGFPSGGLVVENLPVIQEKQETQKIPWRRKWQTTPVFLPGKYYRQRSLTGYSP